MKRSSRSLYTEIVKCLFIKKVVYFAGNSSVDFTYHIACAHMLQVLGWDSCF